MSRIVCSNLIGEDFTFMEIISQDKLNLRLKPNYI